MKQWNFHILLVIQIIVLLIMLSNFLHFFVLLKFVLFVVNYCLLRIDFRMIKQEVCFKVLFV